MANATSIDEQRAAITKDMTRRLMGLADELERGEETRKQIEHLARLEDEFTAPHRPSGGSPPQDDGYGPERLDRRPRDGLAACPAAVDDRRGHPGVRAVAFRRRGPPIGGCRSRADGGAGIGLKERREPAVADPRHRNRPRGALGGLQIPESVRSHYL